MFKYVVLYFVLINVFIFITVFKKPQKKQKQNKYDCAIVCGFPANSDGSPSLIMKSRVEKAIELYRHNKINYIIFSGGKVHNTYEEAAIMERYAISLGLDKKIIIKENKAISTYHNLLYCTKIMNEHNFNSCLVVTNGWHLRKANHYARKNKLNYAMVVADNPSEFNKVKILYLYLKTNLIMYINLFKGYY